MSCPFISKHMISAVSVPEILYNHREEQKIESP